ncbi:MAG: endonuclease/exonuclease/phosphatase family protein [Clostridia bacterium]|nr:endonuclease/exonuclease/phosphatase family protein [Clostridia bacterium]
MVRKVIKISLSVIFLIILLAVIYVAYVLIFTDRVGDQKLEVRNPVEPMAQVQQNYDIISWNIGFGAYTADYDFFMDGGTQSRAVSEEALDANMEDISRTLAGNNADFYMIEEVDTDSTRSYHVDERPYLHNALKDYTYSFAQNYNSAYLMYPLSKPIGASESGIMTFSKYQMTSSLRVEVPIDPGITKVLDLDRCYTVSRLPLEGTDKNLVLYTLHFSAYSADGSIATKQMKIMLRSMQKVYEKGNYCIAGGDFNKDLLGDSSKYFGVDIGDYTWAQPIEMSLFDGTGLRLVAPDPDKPSVRSPDSAFHDGQLVLTVDGFIASENVDVESCKVLYNGFAYSDHNPVKMSFVLD